MFPKITIITPSYNQGHFLEQTILSVIGQMYPNLEYIIMDGGSTDNSVEIIRKYEKYLTHWESQKDGGQAAAINKGFSMATGEILAWLNSDDYYLPGTLLRVSEILSGKLNQPVLVHGGCIHTQEGSLSVFARNDDEVSERLQYSDPFVQPSTFWTKFLWQKTGNLNERMNYVFDWEWYLRASKAGAQFIKSNEYLSVYRKHKDHKSSNAGEKWVNEVKVLIAAYSDKEWQDIFLGVKDWGQLQKRTRWLQRLRLIRCRRLLLYGVYSKYSSEKIDRILGIK